MPIGIEIFKTIKNNSKMLMSSICTINKSPTTKLSVQIYKQTISNIYYKKIVKLSRLLK